MNSRLIQVVAVLLCVGLIAAAATFIPSINDGRRSLNMYGSASPVENAPPDYAFAIQALGAFRGLLTNIAFIRATEYKEKGRYYDAMQLASWICKLQPHFPSVWEFQSWNMAWNISVTTYTPEERWNWVYNGVRLLRDEGLRFNPRAINLYKQLAWTFVNKMSETIDEHHLTYKRNWAWRMHLVLGAPPDPTSEAEREIKIKDFKDVADLTELMKGIAKEGRELPQRDALLKEADKAAALRPYDIARQAAYDFMKSVADAPVTLDALVAQQPDVAATIDALRSLGVVISDQPLTEDDYEANGGLQRTFFLRWLKAESHDWMLSRIRSSDKPDPDADAVQRFEQIVGVRARHPAGLALRRFVQRKVLVEVYKLDPAQMLSVVEAFGPVDWRSVDAHALYWTTRAIIMGGETIASFSNDKTNTTRMLFFALRNLMLRNRIVFEPYLDNIALSYFNPTPDINFIEPMQQAFVNYGPLLAADWEKTVAGAGDNFKSGHINFLIEAIRMLYLADRPGDAAQYLDYLRNTYYRSDDGSINEAFAKPLDKFVMDSFFEGIDGPRETMIAINTLLGAAYGEMANGNYGRCNRLREMAFNLHRDYMAEKQGMEHQKLPPFEDMQADVALLWLKQPAVSGVETIHKARMWQVLPINLRQAVYDGVVESLTTECGWWKFDVARAFPEPPDMAEYRKSIQHRGPDDKPKDFSTPIQNLGG